ncbi:protein kinase [Streptomyces sp. NPDC006704]|uniref:protein kinase n=1 Tax=Streptomyces sp. NPDC006704 TaxID=3364760 RepID=UPI0036C15373
MEDQPIRLLAGRYRLPRPAGEGEDEPVTTRAVDTYTGHAVRLQQVLLPHIIDAEICEDLSSSGSGRVGAGLSRTGEDAVRRAVEAVRAVTRLPDHPRFTQAFDVLVEGTSLWIVSELVEARPLAFLLAERPLSAYRAVEVAADTLAALCALHAQGWVHRNVTASTVLVCADGQVVLDGLAQSVVEEALCGYAPVPHGAAPDPARAPGTDPRASASSGETAIMSSSASLTGTEPTVSLGPHRSSTHGFAGALRADAQRHTPDTAPPPKAAPPRSAATTKAATPSSREAAFAGPTSALTAERARQARITTVGAVTERWAPEQAAPVSDTWHLTPPVGPATDLWALGTLLFRALQGHAPYPEENPADLADMVWCEPPAFAEKCGPLRPIIESLLRPDPADRPDAEALSGWLRSLTRTAPEPVTGIAPPAQAQAGAVRLPVPRRAGPLVRWRRPQTPAVRGRHRQPPRRARHTYGRFVLLGLALPLSAAGAYALVALPGAESTAAPHQADASHPRPSTKTERTGPAPATGSPAPALPSTPDVRLPEGYTIRQDPAGFRLAVGTDWTRQHEAQTHQVRYTQGEFTLIIVPGRDSAHPGDDPLTYQRTEPELAPFHADLTGTAARVRRIGIGQQSMAEGQYTWSDSSGQLVYAQNRATVINGRYHVILAIGPRALRDQVARIFEQAVATYQPST